MPNVSTTKMSSKGQVVIPENIRKKLKLEAGSQFVVVGDKDTIIFKIIPPPSIDQFETLMAEVKRKVRKAGIRQSDIKEAIGKTRKKN